MPDGTSELKAPFLRDPREREAHMHDLVAEAMFDRDPAVSIMRAAVQLHDHLTHEQGMARTYKDELFALRDDFNRLAGRCRQAEGLVVALVELGANYPGLRDFTERLGPEYAASLAGRADAVLGLDSPAKPGRAENIDPTISPKMLREEANRREVEHLEKTQAEAMRPPDGFRSAGSSEKPFA